MTLIVLLLITIFLNIIKLSPTPIFLGFIVGFILWSLLHNKININKLL